jgi:drug/metabolite transporter (DMT)-like permease
MRGARPAISPPVMSMQPASDIEPTSPVPNARSDRPVDRPRAIALMILAITFFSALDTSAKYLGQHYGLPVTQVAWSRFIGQFMALMVLVPVFGSLSLPDLFRTKHLKLQLVRSVLMASTTVLNFLALQTLRLDQAITIVFLAPLVVALLAGPFLGEWVGWRRLVAIAVGFTGVAVAMAPTDLTAGTTGFNIGVLYSLSAMLAYALFMLLTRYMAAFDPPMVTLFYSMFVGTLLGAPIAYLAWTTPPDLQAWLMLASLGFFGGMGHWLFLHAYRLAPASAVAPFLYFQLISMISFGYLVFSDIPDAQTLVGAAIVVASGIYLFHRERISGSSPPAPQNSQ